MQRKTTELPYSTFMGQTFCSTITCPRKLGCKYSTEYNKEINMYVPLFSRLPSRYVITNQNPETCDCDLLPWRN